MSASANNAELDRTACAVAEMCIRDRDITDLSTDKRSHAGLFLSFQAPVEIPGVPVSSFLRAISAGRPGVGDMKGKQFRKHVKELAEELNMDPAYLDRELGVGLSLIHI